MQILSLNEIIRKNNFKYFYLNSTKSTMDEARNKIILGENKFIILADKQSKGRGRRGNQWISSPGNIFCSISFSLDLNQNNLYKLGMLTSVSLKKSLEHINIKNIFFKWPNDIYCENSKISGIVQECHYNKKNKNFIIIGIGINFISSPKNSRYKTTYIKNYVKNIDRDKFFEIFINYFFQYYHNFVTINQENFIQEYKEFQMYLNKNIEIKNENITIYAGQIKV